MENYTKCKCCGKKIDTEFLRMKDWAWRLDDKIYCSYSCYPKEFDKKYKASKVNIAGGGSDDTCTRNRIIDKGYERYGSR